MATLGELELFDQRDNPEDFIECDGRLLKKSKYKKLYLLMGKYYDIKDSEYFYIPDLRENSPQNLKYCIAYKGTIPYIGNK